MEPPAGWHSACPFGRKTAQALNRYLRARAGHKAAHREELWFGLWGPMTESGLYQLLEKRANEAKIGHIKTHLFRHSFAHTWLANGGQEDDLMRLPAGARARCSVATGRAPRMNARGRPTGGCRPEIACEDAVAVAPSDRPLQVALSAASREK